MAVHVGLLTYTFGIVFRLWSKHKFGNRLNPLKTDGPKNCDVGQSVGCLFYDFGPH